MVMPCPDLVLLGRPDHGVSGYAADVASAVQALAPSARSRPVADPQALVELAGEGRPVHVHVTDHLLGRSPAEAADVLEAVAARCELSVTLHDVPQPSDGPERMARRAAGYLRMARAAHRVVVSSEHERSLLRDHVDPDIGASAHVVPLGAAAVDLEAPTNPPARTAAPRVLVAGWIYPGKGHLEAAQAAVRAGSGSGEVVAVGGASPGHEGELDQLRTAVEAAGAQLHVTGVLSRPDYRAQLRGDGVPVVAHQHVSASRTLLEWAEHARRAIVLRSRYSVEMDALRPGLIEVVDPGDLADAIRAAWLDPASTWLPPEVDLRPDLADTARAYLRVWQTA